MSELTTAQRNKLVEDLRVVIADAEELLHLTAEQASGTVAEVRGRIEGRLQRARAELAHLQEAAIAKAKAAGHAADEYVHENPWKAVGAAAGFGLLIGVLISRR
ncbi:MAG: DUF883 family protein [Hylemonella sp.]